MWRPLSNTYVQDYPLALCDSSTIRDEDLIEGDHIRRTFHTSGLYAAYRGTQRWYYLSKQRRDEVTLMKTFDSKGAGVRAKCT